MARLNAVITGWGFYVPPNVLTNADVARMIVEARTRANLSLGPEFTTDAEWITKNTGIKERRIAGEGEFTSTMSAKAAKRALERAGISARDVDAIIVATATPDYLFPATACLVQSQIGAPRAAAFDIEAACTGFISGLAVARGLIISGASETVLVIGAETLSRFLDWTDRGTCILFGDGAGAVVVEASNASVGIESTILHGDGSEGHLLMVPGGGARHPPNGDTAQNGMHYIKMNGPEVFKLAVPSMARAGEEAIAEAGLRPEDIDLVIPHQANLRIIDAVGKRLRMEPGKVFVNIQKYGNTSAASIPIALCEAVEEGRVRRGDRILFVAFGAGFTWGASVTDWFGTVDGQRREGLVGRVRRQLEEIVNR